MVTPTIEMLEAQQARLHLRRFDYAMAWTLGARIQAAAAARDLPVAIEISHGEAVVFFALMPGATPDNSDWTRRKRAVALRFHQSSLYMRLLCEQKNWRFPERFRLSDTDYAASGGGVPITVSGVGIVGAAAVSGLPDVDDHALIVDALEEIQKTA